MIPLLISLNIVILSALASNINRMRKQSDEWDKLRNAYDTNIATYKGIIEKNTKAIEQLKKANALYYEHIKELQRANEQLAAEAGIELIDQANKNPDRDMN